MSLTPTLDAGCAFDFVGMIEDTGIVPEKGFVRIDATCSISAKKRKENTTCNGQRQWPFRIACIHGKTVSWYDESASVFLKKTPLPKSHNTDKELSASGHCDNAAFAKVRREVLEQIEFGHSIPCALDYATQVRNVDEAHLKTLKAHAVFFSAYKYALNIVPALSCGDLCDFIGEHDGELVRYRVLTNTNGYYENERPIIEQFSKAFKYMVALYDYQTRTFKFYDWDSCMLFNDIPDFDERK